MDYEGISSGIDVELLNRGQLLRYAEVKREYERLKRNSGIEVYCPLGKIRQFHETNKKIRFIIGGNRSGKTVAGACETVWLAMGMHPWIKMRCPVSIWVVSLDFPSSRDIAEMEIRRWLPVYMIKKWNVADRIITLTNGSMIGFKSCDSGREKFQGVMRDAIWFDEEPPYNIWEECYMRTLDKKGLLYCTMTPTNGMSWVYDEIWELRGIDMDIYALPVTIYDNKYIPASEIDKIRNKFGPEEQKIRLLGEFIQFAGLVYKNFDKKVHIVKPFDIPVDWKKFRSIDWGINNPTACLWAAVNKDDEIYIYDEYYESDKTVKESAEDIRHITAGVKIEWTVIDPTTTSRSGVDKSIRDSYYDHGVVTKLGNNDKDNGLNRVRQLLEINDKTNRSKLFFFDHCYATIKEILRYRYKEYKTKEDKNVSEQPAKVLDHAMDALRYLVMSNPRYDIWEEDKEPERKVWYK